MAAESVINGAELIVNHPVTTDHAWLESTADPRTFPPTAKANSIESTPMEMPMDETTE